MTHHIVILGGNLGGLSAAHYLLNHITPKLKDIQITVISPNKKAFFKIAAPRVIAAPSKISPSQIFLPFEEGFSNKKIEFVYARATKVDPVNRTVEADRTIRYDSLIIATGSTYNSDLWNSIEDTEKVYADYHERILKAESILIAGGGAVGVETAAEIAENFSKKRVILLTGSKALPHLAAKSSIKAERQLAALGVKVVNERMISQTHIDGRTRVTAKDFSEDVDLFIDATGGVPNSDFLPPAWLNESKHVMVDNTLRGTGPDMKQVYAIGEVGSYTTRSIMDILEGVKALASSIGIDLGLSITQVKYSPWISGQIVTVGSGGGIFDLNGWSLPSFLARWIKSKDMMISEAEALVGGSKWK